MLYSLNYIAAFPANYNATKIICTIECPKIQQETCGQILFERLKTILIQKFYECGGKGLIDITGNTDSTSEMVITKLYISLIEFVFSDKESLLINRRKVKNFKKY